MSHELSCLRIIADFPGRSGIQVAGIVKRTKLPVLAVDQAMSVLRKSGYVARPLVGPWSSPGYTATAAGLAALEQSA